MQSLGARFRRFLPVLIAGAYAWLVTVAPALLRLSEPSWALALGWLGLPFLVAAAGVREARLRLALGVYAFLGSAALVWGFAPASSSSLVARSMSALAWVIYTWAWGALSASPPAPEKPALDAVLPRPIQESRPVLHGLLLSPRFLAPPWALAIPVLAVAAGLYLLAPLGLVASGGARPATDILGQILGLAGALVLVRQAADWGNDQHFPRSRGERVALRTVVPPLALLLTAAGCIIWWKLRR